MNYSKIKFEVYTSSDKLKTLKYSLHRLLNEFDENFHIYEIKLYLEEKENNDSNSFKLEFVCNKDFALEVITVIKKVFTDKIPYFNIIPIIN